MIDVFVRGLSEFSQDNCMSWKYISSLCHDYRTYEVLVKTDSGLLQEVNCGYKFNSAYQGDKSYEIAPEPMPENILAVFVYAKAAGETPSIYVYTNNPDEIIPPRWAYVFENGEITHGWLNPPQHTWEDGFSSLVWSSDPVPMARLNAINYLIDLATRSKLSHWDRDKLYVHTLWMTPEQKGVWESCEFPSYPKS